MQMQYGSKGSSSNWRLRRQRRWRYFDLRIEPILECLLSSKKEKKSKIARKSRNKIFWLKRKVLH